VQVIDWLIKCVLVYQSRYSDDFEAHIDERELFKLQEAVKSQALEQGHIRAERECAFLEQEAHDCDECFRLETLQLQGPVSSQGTQPVVPASVNFSNIPMKPSNSNSIPIKPSKSNPVHIHNPLPLFNNPTGLLIGCAILWKDCVAYHIVPSKRGNLRLFVIKAFTLIIRTFPMILNLNLSLKNSSYELFTIRIHLDRIMILLLRNLLKSLFQNVSFKEGLNLKIPNHILILLHATSCSQIMRVMVIFLLTLEMLLEMITCMIMVSHTTNQNPLLLVNPNIIKTIPRLGRRSITVIARRNNAIVRGMDLLMEVQYFIS
jgi:hypothetical protein